MPASANSWDWPMDPDATAIAAGTPFRTLRGGHLGSFGRLLGAGGQGAVYTADLRGSAFALKWYHPSYAAIDTGLRPRLLRAIEQGAPNDAFLWPIDLVEITGTNISGQPGARPAPSFGYIMRLRDPEYAGMRDLIARPPTRIEPPLPIRAAICLHIAESFLQLHAGGFCYQDLNFGNVFFCPRSGGILICDNDNVDVDGVPASVFGTRKFMAPEIVRREAMPSTKSDLFSMAVLFFYVLHAWHPLDGRREAAVDIMDAAAETSLYGNKPVFLFDPVDTSNGPLPGMHEPVAARWNALPAALRALFIRSFTSGLHQPGSRVQEAEWRAAFAGLATASFACGGCGFGHAAEVLAGGIVASPPACVACGAALPRPAVLAVGRVAVCLQPGCRVPLHVLAPARPFAPEVAGAVVEQHPAKPGIWGLRNLTGEPWRMRLQDSSAVAVPPGSAMRLLDGTVVEFAGSSGTVVMPATATGMAPGVVLGGAA